MMNQTQRRRYRQALAWTGFVTIYLALPILAVFLVYLTAQAHNDPRANIPFYQQTEDNQH